MQLHALKFLTSYFGFLSFFVGWRRMPVSFYTPDYAGAAKRVLTHNFPIGKRQSEADLVLSHDFMARMAQILAQV